MGSSLCQHLEIDNNWGYCYFFSILTGANNVLTETEVLKIAKLAKLSLNEAEVKQFSHQLAEILNYVDLLNELDTTDIPPTTRVIPVNNVFREDIVQPGLKPSEALQNAPEKENNFFKVPKI